VLTSGNNIFNAQGAEINSAVAGVVMPASYLVLGLGGIALLADLIKDDKSKSE
jgi:hypothetical protein